MMVIVLQQIHDVEHLWHCSESEMEQLRQSEEAARHAMENNSPDFLNNLCHIADHRLYKIVKWCKSLPLFRHITVGSGSTKPFTPVFAPHNKRAVLCKP